MLNYEDYLKSKGKVTTNLFVCPKCGTSGHPAFALVERADRDWVCSNCWVNEQQEKQRIAEKQRRAALPPWETDDANEVRAVRVQLQQRWRWAVMPDSPLSAQAQARVMSFLKLLNTLTIDYTCPDDVIWPVEPILNGDDYASDA